MIPTIHSYCDNTTAANAMAVDVDGVTFYFSYRTCVAVSHHGKTIVRENVWGPTTGKHLNAIDGGDKASRVGVVEFQVQLKQLMAEAIAEALAE